MRAGLNQGQLAERADTDASYLCQIEQGHRDTRWTTLMRVLDALDATLSTLEDAIEQPATVSGPLPVAGDLLVRPVIEPERGGLRAR